MKTNLIKLMLVVPLLLLGMAGCIFDEEDDEDKDTQKDRVESPSNNQDLAQGGDPFGVVKDKTIDDEDENQDIEPEDDQDAVDAEVSDKYFDSEYKRVCTIKHDGVQIVLLKKIDFSDTRTNPDKTIYYRTSLVADINDNGLRNRVTLFSIAESDIYTDRSNDIAMLPCMAYETGSKTVSVFQNSKDYDSGAYGLEGYVFRFDLKNLRVSVETVFTRANFGWFAYFNGLNNGQLELSHFSFAGYYEIQSLRDNLGTWSYNWGSRIMPDDYKAEAKRHGKTLVINTGNNDKSDKVMPEDGLVAYYPFDGNTKDYSGFQNNGTPQQYAEYTTGVVGKAFKFGGIDDIQNIVVPNNESLQIYDAATFSMWFNLSDIKGMDGWGNTTDRGYHVLFAKYRDWGYIYAGVGIAESGKYTIDFAGGSDALIDGCNVEVDADVINNWNHVAFTVTSNGAKIFFNGQLVREVEQYVSFATTNEKNLYIGSMTEQSGWAPYGWFPFCGMIDEFRFYNRELSNSEIKILANQR